MAGGDDIIAQLEAEQAQQEAAAQQQQASTFHRINSQQPDQVGIGVGIQSALSGFKNGKSLASMLGSKVIAPTIAKNFTPGGTAVSDTSDMTGSWGAVNSASSGPWAALTAAVRGIGNPVSQAPQEGGYGLNGGSPSSDKINPAGIVGSAIGGLLKKIF